MPAQATNVKMMSFLISASFDFRRSALFVGGMSNLLFRRLGVAV
jgi:hypothetical protein